METIGSGMGSEEELLPDYGDNDQKYNLWVKHICSQIPALPPSCLVTLGDVLAPFKLTLLMHTDGTLNAGRAVSCRLAHSMQT